MLDTSSLFSGTAHHLVSIRMRELIEQANALQDLRVRFYLPSIVRDERIYQMRKKADSYLPKLEKIELLLGHNLGIASHLLHDRIARVVEEQVEELGLEVVEITSGSVEWAAVLAAAAFRLPPFEASDKEKGFRDAMILETACQVASRLKPSARCQFVFIASDNLLLTAATKRMTGSSYTSVLADTDELQGLVNTLASQITKEQAASYRTKAISLFFTSGDPKSLYISADIYKLINEQFAEELAWKPLDATGVEHGRITLGNPIFEEKRSQHLVWTTPVFVEMKPFRKPPVGEQSDWVRLLRRVAEAGGTEAPSANENLPPFKHLFHVRWRFTLSRAGRTSHPKVEDVRYQGLVGSDS